MRTRRTRLEPFFERALDKRSQEVEDKRLARATALGARALADGRLLVEGSEDVYYLRAGTGAPVCFCLDSHRGQDRCKHVMAALRQEGDKTFGPSWEWKRKAPWSTTGPNFPKILEFMKKGLEDGEEESVSATSWILSWPRLQLEHLKLALEARSGFMMCLGVLRFSEAAKDREIRDLVWSKALEAAEEGHKWAEVVVGRLLPWMEGSEAKEAWKWLKSRITDLEAASILEAAGGDTARKIPREELVGLMKSEEAKIREKTIKALRTSELPATVSLLDGQKTVRRRAGVSKPVRKTVKLS